MNTAMPKMLWVPCRWPPDSSATSRENPSVRNPNELETDVS